MYTNLFIDEEAGIIMSLGKDKAASRGNKLGMNEVQVYQLRTVARGQTPKNPVEMPKAPAVTAGSSPESRAKKVKPLAKSALPKTEKKTIKEREDRKALKDVVDKTIAAGKNRTFGGRPTDDRPKGMVKKDIKEAVAKEVKRRNIKNPNNLIDSVIPKEYSTKRSPESIAKSLATRAANKAAKSNPAPATTTKPKQSKAQNKAAAEARRQAKASA